MTITYVLSGARRVCSVTLPHLPTKYIQGIDATLVELDLFSKFLPSKQSSRIVSMGRSSLQERWRLITQLFPYSKQRGDNVFICAYTFLKEEITFILEAEFVGHDLSLRNVGISNDDRTPLYGTEECKIVLDGLEFMLSK